MIELLPCPFCGVSDTYQTQTGDGWPVVRCDDCGAQGPCVELHSTGALAKWNTRAVAQQAPDHRIGAVLKWHFPAGIECDHKTSTDRVICSCGEWRCDPQPSVDAAMDRWVEHVLSQDWKCGARQGSTGANPPQECNWPVCSCDPYADKVIAALQEHGILPEAKSDSAPYTTPGTKP